jgi:hypothetical protein
LKRRVAENREVELELRSWERVGRDAVGDRIGDASPYTAVRGDV